MRPKVAIDFNPHQIPGKSLWTGGIHVSPRETVSLPNKCEYSKHPDGDQLIIPCLHDHRSSCRVGAAAATSAIRIYGNGISISLGVSVKEDCSADVYR